MQLLPGHASPTSRDFDCGLDFSRPLSAPERSSDEIRLGLLLFSCCICVESRGIAAASWLRRGQNLPERDRPQDPGVQSLQVMSFRMRGLSSAPSSKLRGMACPVEARTWELTWLPSYAEDLHTYVSKGKPQPRWQPGIPGFFIYISDRPWA